MGLYFSAKSDVLNAFHLPYNEGSGSNTTAALILLRQMFTVVNGDRTDRPNIAVIMVDGWSSDQNVSDNHHDY